MTSKKEAQAFGSYEIVSAQTIVELVNRVNHAINKGWSPQGGVSSLKYSNGESLIFQAIVKNS